MGRKVQVQSDMGSRLGGDFMKRLFFAVSMSLTLSAFGGSRLNADIIELDLFGTSGEGLLPGNVTPGTSSSGSGGEGSIGLLFDTATSNLTVDIVWGSGNGFGDLSGEVTLLHLHGPTANAAPDSFTEVTTNILVNMTTSLTNNSANGGGLTEVYFINPSDVAALLAGQTYINVHTEMYDMGEIRGYIVPASAIPEPGTVGLLGLLTFGILSRRRRGCHFNFGKISPSVCCY